MTNITAAMVKELRDTTGAGMMDCKKALNETGGDMEAAIDWLRKSGAMKAAKKASRAAADGLVGVAVAGNTGVLVEVNAETDFVARNEDFKEFVKSASQIALKEGGDLAKLLAAPHGSSSVQQVLTELVAKIGENMSVRRTIALSVNPGVVVPYVHNAASPELGNIGVLEHDLVAGHAALRFKLLGYQIELVFLGRAKKCRRSGGCAQAADPDFRGLRERLAARRRHRRRKHSLQNCSAMHYFLPVLADANAQLVFSSIPAACRAAMYPNVIAGPSVMPPPT